MSLETFLYVANLVIPAAASLLPEKLDSKPARSMLLAIGLQESQFFYRHQVAGPAHGFWQFEPAGVRAVMRHPLTRPLVASVRNALCYPDDSGVIYDAIADNDVLACAFARMLLWASPLELPPADDPQAGWTLYYDNWRPGRPHRATWNDNFRRGWNPTEMVTIA